MDLKNILRTPSEFVEVMDRVATRMRKTMPTFSEALEMGRKVRAEKNAA